MDDHAAVTALLAAAISSGVVAVRTNSCAAANSLAAAMASLAAALPSLVDTLLTNSAAFCAAPMAACAANISFGFVIFNNDSEASIICFAAAIHYLLQP